MTGSSRREFLKLLGAVPAVTAARQAFAWDQMPRCRSSLLPPKHEIWRWMKLVNRDFGPQRLTGTEDHVAFVDWLAARYAAVGCTIQRDHYTFKRWEADMVKSVGASVSIPGQRKPVQLDVLSYYPFSGSTLSTGPVTGELLFVPGDGTPTSASTAARNLAANPPANLAGSIVVIESPVITHFPYTFWGTFPADAAPAVDYANAGGQLINGVSGVFTALDGKCKGILLCWTNVSDENARFQYTPFGGAHRKIPALWVGRDTGEFLKSLAGTGAQITMRLDATITPGSPTDTLIATLPGKSDEIVLVCTHTDGPNLPEENGGIGMLAMATYASRIPYHERNRTLVFSMATGHFSGGAFADKTSATGPNGQVGVGGGTTGVLRDHPEIAAKTVAGLAVEHLGCMEWMDDATATEYGPTGLPEFDDWYVGSHAQTATIDDAYAAAIAQITLAAAEDEPARQMRMWVAKTGTGFGESGALRARGIPAVGLIPTPNYLCAAGPRGEIEKLRPSRVLAQVQTCTKIMTLMDRLSVDQLRGLAPIGAADLDVHLAGCGGHDDEDDDRDDD